jgi:NADH dehydrogenase FAD-containing subunit
MKLLAQQLRPADRVRVTLICDTTTAWYSGMLPACLAQIYHPSGALRVVCRVCVRVRLIDLISCEVVAELQIRLEPLAKWCGARFIHARAERIEFARNLVVCQRVADHQSGDLTDYPPRPPPTTADDAEAEAEGEELRCEDYVPSIPYDLLAVDIGSVTKVRVTMCVACRVSCVVCRVSCVMRGSN